uniref:histone acetyltransferase n=1 Tax=Compsopogon caeruleus TaxID=31354 RepID=A0A6T6CJQ9_9RHOD|mmetsp:Transcript_7640/g.15496  ORF Transcript_7640/g.15496 Transcript_7640/m.15496 type:complete len:494 (+) Transcript_7640:103-1584(+)|eukprot:CAMPEP_0184689248 /NCGR_PEP_ID=MMETSP0312-20130426/30551_1 /TAXON_ID=31354 /ORGANISM="Compsopogon coeruleus, Strain SAG 36.94" /LENGTH=493 /DNA_ID=CAMNT_0027146577 /DNA_START=74 /DNA_END=1555 /DNA_ORIENTATION=-
MGKRKTRSDDEVDEYSGDVGIDEGMEVKDEDAGNGEMKKEEMLLVGKEEEDGKEDVLGKASESKQKRERTDDDEKDESGSVEAGAEQTDPAADEVFRIEPICKVPPAREPRIPPPGAWAQSTDDILGPDSQHNYVQRWRKMSDAEKNGTVIFKVVRNDNKRESMVYLLGLKNVFVKQLPNMPKPYVTRLVMDRKHESVALLNRGPSGELQVMGGCCYRPFPQQKFGEIAFLAISHVQQVQGYGTRLMAQTKERSKAIGLTHLLTCADNAAVPYFKKQGFSKKITLPMEAWQGYIKDYEGVTLMECKLHPKIDYLNVPLLLKAQKMALIEKLREVSNCHIVFPGIDVKAKGGIDIEDIPGIKEIGLKNIRGHGFQGSRSGAASVAARDPAARQALQKLLQSILTQIKNHNSAWPFLQPVNAAETGAVDYYDVIKNPIDLQTIQERLDLGWYYITKEIFVADLKRMVANCIQYNGKGHYITDLALSLEKFFMQKL